jgi:hypothetical protein
VDALALHDNRGNPVLERLVSEDEDVDALMAKIEKELAFCLFLPIPRQCPS